MSPFWSRRKKHAGGEGSVPDGSPARHHLEAEARRLEPLGRSIVRDARVYLVEGGDDAVLSELASRPEVGELLSVKLCGQRTGFVSRDNRAGDLASLVGMPAQAWVRFGRFLAAPVPPEKLGTLYGSIEIPPWLEMLLWECSSLSPVGWSSLCESTLVADDLEAALVSEGDDPALLARMAIYPDVDWSRPRQLALHVKGMGAILARYPDAVTEMLAGDGAKELDGHLEVLHLLGADPTPWIERVAELACTSRKTVARRAQTLLADRWDGAVATLERVAEAGKPAERLGAVELLAAHGGDGVRGFLEERAERDGSAKVREALAKVSAPATPARPDVELPPREPLEPPGPLTRAQLDSLATLARAWEERERDRYEQAAKRMDESKIPAQGRIGDRDLEQLAASLGDPRKWAEEVSSALPAQNWYSGYEKEIHACCEGADWSLIQFVRLLQHVRSKGGGHFMSRYGVGPDLVSDFCAARGGAFELRDLADAAEWSGLTARSIGEEILGQWGSPHVLEWPDDAIWPYFAEHPEPLTAALGLDGAGLDTSDWAWAEKLGTAYRVLGTFPRIPAGIADGLWGVALGTSKLQRPLAQGCLANEPDRLDRIGAALGDGKQEVRAAAARWLGELELEDAAPLLERALAKERSDVAKAAMLTALEALGRDLEKYLDREALVAEAEKGLRKVPKAAQWVAGLALPEVRWADSGEPLPEAVVRWWLVKGVKLKDPAPDALLRRYVSMLRSDDAAELGDHVLAAWIAEDTRTPVEVTSVQRAQWKASAAQWQTYYADRTVEEIAASFEREYLSSPVGSAIASKGVLALVAACNAPAAAESVERYLKTWYGTRLAHGKALLAMLCWVDDPLATQLLLATAVRFRTAALRKEAERLSEELAERRGWTMDELADRTIPTAGFDEGGRQELTYAREGPPDADPEDPALVTRRFALRLAADLTVHVVKEDGKELKSLPSPQKAESEASVKAAKKALSAAKRGVKQIVQRQGDRLYEAMCLERAWSVLDWRTYLAAHPVVGHLCRRVVWMERRAEGDPVAFRPLEDGSLTDAHDEEVELAEGSTVQVAHGSLMSEEEVAAWAQHLADFEVDPLVAQFPAALAELPADYETLTDIEAFKGWMTTAFAVRGRASKLGYTRGEAEDAGWFHYYRKAFPSLGIEAVLEFTGNSLPEEERDCALVAFYFARSAQSQAWGRAEKLPLGDVPSVLLAEGRSDLSQFASTSTGYDPEWESKSEP